MLALLSLLGLVPNYLQETFLQIVGLSDARLSSVLCQIM